MALITYGYSQASMSIVKQLRDRAVLDSFIRMADDLRQPAQYSNQQFDREQALAYLLTRLSEI